MLKWSHLTCPGCEATVDVVIESIRRVLQSPWLPHQPRVVSRLALLLPEITTSHARASLVWCVSQHVKLLPELAPETLRRLLLGFPDEPTAVKLQSLTLAVKCAACDLPRSVPMLQYALELARFDMDCDVRARARLLSAVTPPAPAAKPSTPTTTTTLLDGGVGDHGGGDGAAEAAQSGVGRAVGAGGEGGAEVTARLADLFLRPPPGRERGRRPR